MKLYKGRYDIVISFILAFFGTIGAGRLIEQVISLTYEAYVREHTVEDGEIGGRAGKDIFRAEKVNNLLSCRYFTVEARLSDFYGSGGGVYGKQYLHRFTLPSGEIAAAAINWILSKM